MDAIEKAKELSKLAHDFINAVEAGDNNLAKEKFEELFCRAETDYSIYPQEAFDEAVTWIENPAPITAEDHDIFDGKNQREITVDEKSVIDFMRSKLLMLEAA